MQRVIVLHYVVPAHWQKAANYRNRNVQKHASDHYWLIRKLHCWFIGPLPYSRPFSGSVKVDAVIPGLKSYRDFRLQTSIIE